MSTVADLFKQSGLWQWFNSGQTQGYNPPTEYGADFSTTLGTPIGAIAGGTVVANYANPGTSINNQVLIATPGGSVWEYQHINSSLQVGQTIPVGGIVGTENGQPTSNADPYSTGPHIEVRYASNYNPALGIGQQWMNPTLAFSQAASADTGPSLGDILGGAAIGGTGVIAQNPQAASAIVPSSLLSGLGIGSINWQDVGIRTALILVGILLLLLAVAKLLQKPSVVVEEK